MTANRPIAHCRLAFAPPCPTTSPRRSTTSTPRPISGTRTPRSPPTSWPGTCASGARRSSSSPAPTSTASPSRRRPSAPASPPASSPTATPSASRTSRRSSRSPTTSSSAPATCPHVQRVQDVLQTVHDNGHVYKGLYEGWYCPRCADFKSGTEIGPDNTCPIHGIPLEWEHEENWFFRLSDVPEAARGPVRPTPRLRRPPRPLQRGPRVHRPGPAGRLADPRQAQLGRPRPLGRQPGLLRLVRRAPQLLHGALLRRPGRGPDRHASGRRPTTSSARTSSSSTRSTGPPC